jgi:hypothetical protein
MELHAADVVLVRIRQVKVEGRRFQSRRDNHGRKSMGRDES